MNEKTKLTIDHDFFKNDPCYGCEYAKVKDTVQWFERKYWCTNFFPRIARSVNLAKSLLAKFDESEQWDIGIANLLHEAGKELSFAADMIGQSVIDGKLDPVDTVVSCPFHKKYGETPSKNSSAC